MNHFGKGESAPVAGFVEGASYTGMHGPMPLFGPNMAGTKSHQLPDCPYEALVGRETPAGRCVFFFAIPMLFVGYEKTLWLSPVRP